MKCYRLALTAMLACFACSNNEEEPAPTEQTQPNVNEAVAEAPTEPAPTTTPPTPEPAPTETEEPPPERPTVNPEPPVEEQPPAEQEAPPVEEARPEAPEVPNGNEAPAKPETKPNGNAEPPPPSRPSTGIARPGSPSRPTRVPSRVPTRMPTRRRPIIDKCEATHPVSSAKRIGSLSSGERARLCGYTNCVLRPGVGKQCNGYKANAGPSRSRCLADNFWQKCASLPAGVYKRCVKKAYRDPCKAIQVLGEDRDCAQLLACGSGTWTNPLGCKMPPPIRKSKKLSQLTKAEKGLLCDYGTCGFGGYNKTKQCSKSSKVSTSKSRSTCIRKVAPKGCGNVRVSQYLSCAKKTGTSPCEGLKTFLSDPACAPMRNCAFKTKSLQQRLPGIFE